MVGSLLVTVTFLALGGVTGTYAFVRRFEVYAGGHGGHGVSGGAVTTVATKLGVLRRRAEALAGQLHPDGDGRRAGRTRLEALVILPPSPALKTTGFVTMVPIDVLELVTETLIGPETRVHHSHFGGDECQESRVSAPKDRP